MTARDAGIDPEQLHWFQHQSRDYLPTEYISREALIRLRRHYKTLGINIVDADAHGGPGLRLSLKAWVAALERRRHRDERAALEARRAQVLADHGL